MLYHVAQLHNINVATQRTLAQAPTHTHARCRNFDAKIKELRDKRPRVPDIVDILLFRMMITAAMVCKWLMDFCRLRACEYYLSYYCTQKLRLFAALFTSPLSLPLTAPFIRWQNGRHINIRGPNILASTTHKWGITIDALGHVYR